MVKVDDKGALIIGLIENIQREDLNPIDAALGIKQLMEEFSFTHAEAAEAIGRSRPYVTNFLRLLSLPSSIQDSLRDGQLDAGHARALLPLTTEEQLRLAEEITSKGLSVRQAEELAAEAEHQEKDSNKEKENASEKDKEKSYIHRAMKTELPATCDSWATQFGDSLGAKVKVKAYTGGKGKIVISFDSRDELEKIMSSIHVKT